MTLRKIILAVVVLVVAAFAVLRVIPYLITAPANGVMTVKDAYLRTSTAQSKSGAAFLTLTNTTGRDDRLISVQSNLDGMVQLHRHTQDANGVMMMGEIDGGVPLAAGESHLFERGGDHLMFMGLTAPLEQGSTVPVTLIFESAGEVTVDVVVDSTR